MQIQLNLASRPYANLGPLLRQMRFAMAGLGAVSVVLVGGLYAFHSLAESARTREHAVDQKIRQQISIEDASQATLHKPENVKLLEETASLNQLFREKAFSWTVAMEDLEAVLPSGVQLSTLEPERGKDGRITLHLRVNGPRDHVLELVENLERSHRFRQPRIVGENAESTGQGPGQRQEPIAASNRFNFDLLSAYDPTAPREGKQAERLGAAMAAPAPVAEAPRVQPPMPRPGVQRPAQRPQPIAQQPQMPRIASPQERMAERQRMMENMQRRRNPGMPPGFPGGGPRGTMPGDGNGGEQ